MEDKLISLAKRKGWKRCPSCRRLVEKVTGCDHISCRCGQHFCYKCGEPYSLSYGHHCPGPRQPQQQQH
ncbi:hypothetical protein F5B22DRAFT_623554 [Xylaria bambusicola]|uniref:uncharacterized protein n=1 Tax=Xylaria bambusicola TaxID=326684 RepID=UPI002008E991|nr:uncharacterized protein F5B22DRAFT_623554 [Xylaria bambusicola]KAI0506436.1 hypothetical protein F5B22DRAFT_623554 [Xylaria bambusicola]